MMTVNSKKIYTHKNHHGVVLLVTLVLLIVLSIVGYTLTTRVSAWRHRCQYIMDYQAARYACDAGIKYALTRLHEINPKLIERPNEPDFSDLFALSESEYKQLLQEWAAQKALQKQKNNQKNDLSNLLNMGYGNQSTGFFDNNEVDDLNNITNEANDFSGPAQVLKPKKVSIRGPYGPAWPLVTKPTTFEIGSADIRITIEDENAKYPLGWMLLNRQDIQMETEAGFKTFCEWMNIDNQEFLILKQDLDEIAEIKSFRLKYPNIKKSEKVTTTRTITRGRRKIEIPKTEIKKITIPASVHTKVFGKLFNSSMVNTDILARPTILSEDRKESALKYIGLWGSSTVNINTAPRNVLEAAFTFGGDAAEIADEIIKQRRIKPFKDIAELRSSLLEFADSIDKCEPYISTASTFFTMRVTVTSGTAKTSTVIAVKKEDRKIQKIAVMSD